MAIDRPLFHRARRFCLLLVLSGLAAGCRLPKPGDTRLENGVSDWGVSTGHPLATEAGLTILAQGGNAIDAAVAIAYALGVVAPHTCGVGGGGIMLIYLAKSARLIVLDYRETAPSGARANDRVGLPGLVAGLHHALVHYGTFDRAAVLAPAIDLARLGFPVSPFLAGFFSRYNPGRISKSGCPVFFRGERTVQAGETLRQPDLADTLSRIAEQGPDAFYQGELAEDICRVVRVGGGNLAPGDLREYRIRQTGTAHARFGAYEVAAPPSPGGGTTLLEMLRLADLSGTAGQDRRGEKRVISLARAMALAYQDRLRFLGDRQGARKAATLLDEGYLRHRQEIRDPVSAREESNEETTSHFVVADAEGNWVSSTQTISDFFGSGLYCHGFFLNNALANFSANPSSPNRPGPGRRPFSYISPCLILKEGRPVLGIGTAGGRRIPALLTEVLFSYLCDGLTLKEAVEAFRWYLAPGGELCFEADPGSDLLLALRRAGYKCLIGGRAIVFGAVQALALENGRLIGAADARREGSWAVKSR